MDSFRAFYDNIRLYSDGLDAHQVLSELEFKGFDPVAYTDTISKDKPEDLLKVAVVGAIRGSKWSKLKDTHIDFAALGYTEKLTPGHKDPTVKTILRTTAVLAPEVAHFLEKDKNLKKRIPESPVPACLQFPAAGAVRMGPKATQLHKEFCIKFSLLLPGGQFNEDIYNAMCKHRREIHAISDEVKAFISV